MASPWTLLSSPCSRRRRSKTLTKRLPIRAVGFIVKVHLCSKRIESHRFAVPCAGTRRSGSAPRALIPTAKMPAAGLARTRYREPVAPMTRHDRLWMPRVTLPVLVAAGLLVLASSSQASLAQEKAKTQANDQKKPEAKDQKKPEAKDQKKPEAKDQKKPEAKDQKKPEAKDQKKPEAKPQPKDEKKPQAKPAPAPAPRLLRLRRSRRRHPDQ